MPRSQLEDLLIRDFAHSLHGMDAQALPTLMQQMAQNSRAGLKQAPLPSASGPAAGTPTSTSRPESSAQLDSGNDAAQEAQQRKQGAYVDSPSSTAGAAAQLSPLRSDQRRAQPQKTTTQEQDVPEKQAPSTVQSPRRESEATAEVAEELQPEAQQQQLQQQRGRQDQERSRAEQDERSLLEERVPALSAGSRARVTAADSRGRGALPPEDRTAELLGLPFAAPQQDGQRPADPRPSERSPVQQLAAAANNVAGLPVALWRSLDSVFPPQLRAPPGTMHTGPYPTLSCLERALLFLFAYFTQHSMHQHEQICSSLLASAVDVSARHMKGGWSIQL